MTVSSIIWNTPIYDAKNPIPIDVANTCIKLLCSTSRVGIRDFANFGPTQMAAKVAYVKNQPGNINNGVNYLKVRTGRDSKSASSEIDVVIVYQYLNHRSTPNNSSGTGGKPGTWASSVGFSAWLVPNVSTSSPGTIDPNVDPSYPYAILALSIAKQMQADLKSFTPIGTTSYIYDDVSTVDPNNFENPLSRRISPVGELGWVAEHSNDVNKLFSFSTIKETAPTTSTGLVIPNGYFRPGDSNIIITTVTAK